MTTPSTDCRRSVDQVGHIHRDILELNGELLEIVTEPKFDNAMLKVTALESHVRELIRQLKAVNFKPNLASNFWRYKFKQKIESLLPRKIKLQYLLKQILDDALKLSVLTNETMDFIFRLSTMINELSTIDERFMCLARETNLMANNSCPSMFYPCRNVSITYIVQLVALNRAESCSHRLIDCLLENYKLLANDTVSVSGDETRGFDLSIDDDRSDSSSLEIYRALTKHMTPPHATPLTSTIQNTEDVGSVTEASTPRIGARHFHTIEILMQNIENDVIDLLTVAARAVPRMFGTDAIKTDRATGGARLSRRAQNKVTAYFQQVLWGEVGTYLEHIVLWWSKSPLCLRPPHSSQHLREWLLQFTVKDEAPPIIKSTLNNLSDSLGCFVTSTSWDLNFQKALVSAYNYKEMTSIDSATCRLFTATLKDLIHLSNQCEKTHNWTVGAPLDELPLVEQIPILHRLDHTVHSTRMWMLSENRSLANHWRIEKFFLIVQKDMKVCVDEIGHLTMQDHTVAIAKGNLGVHVEVCANMREKLVSEVKVNVEQLKTGITECIDVLARACRTICLSNLILLFPDAKYWRRKPIVKDQIPRTASEYVTEYLDRVLLPVVEATNDPSTSNMILKLVCEAWLDYIYLNRIKFNQFGALQLLLDFSSVSDWLINCSIITHDVRVKMLKNEVLRRCEGVGKLLLRSHGEKIDMNKNLLNQDTTDGDETSMESLGAETMPAEMYVPNQEQWLELRLTERKSFILPCWCDS